MARYVVKRLILAVVTIFIVCAITFFAMNAIPGGPFNARVFDTCQKYKTLQTAEMRAFLCQILFIFMLYGVVLYAIIRYEALVR